MVFVKECIALLVHSCCRLFIYCFGWNACHLSLYGWRSPCYSFLALPFSVDLFSANVLHWHAYFSHVCRHFPLFQLCWAVVYYLVGIYFIAGFPKFRVFVITFLLAMIFMWGIRICVKYLYDTAVKDQATQNVYIYGIQEGGIALAKSMRNDNPRQYMVKGFISGKAENIDKFILGVRVHKADEEVVNHMRASKANMLFVSPLLSETFRENDKLVNALTKAGIKIMMLPAAETWDGKSSLQHSRLHEVDIEDLLPRDKIEVDMNAIGKLLYNKRILITGAAGSIGSEMVHQIASFKPAELVLVDQAETPMHQVRLFMEHSYPKIKCWTIVGSIANPSQMEQIFKVHRPEYVFHAAAYKHVPMMEDNPSMAIQNNTYGTRVIADLAVKYGTRKFVMISTDKAVNPTNVMGCSKRISEIYCQSLDRAIRQQLEGTSTSPILLRQIDGSPAVTQFITTSCHRHRSRDHPLLYAHPRGLSARARSWHNGKGWRDFRVRHGQACPYCRTCSTHD